MTEPRTLTLTPGEYFATKDKVDKINARAAKRGFTGRITLEATRHVSTETNELGFETKRVLYAVQLGGQAPKYGDWTLLATLDWDHGNLIIHTAPGVDKVARGSLREGWCDHCQTNRRRNGTYLVGNGKRTIQVGSTCIKDFLGWQAKPVFISEEGALDDIERNLSGGYYREENYPVTTVIAAAWAAVQVYGYRPSSFDGSTKGTVLTILDPHSKWEREEAAKLRPYLDKAYPQATVILDWVLSAGFNGDTEFVRNLKALAASEFVSSRSVGYLASTPQVWARAQERDLVRRQAKAELNNEWLGALKDRVQVTVKIQSIRYFDSDWGTSTLYTMVDTAGHVLKWFSSNGALGDETSDERQYTIKGTIKKLEEWQGTKQTQLTRCTLIEEVTK